MNPIRATNAPYFRLRIAWDGSPIVSAELLAPRAWNLALHPDPSCTFWTVSDASTGRLVATGWTRDEAINEAHHRLQTAADAHGLSIEALLDAVRASARHFPGQDEEESE